MGKKTDKPADEDPSALARAFVNPTPKGQMKSFEQPMAGAYHPHEVEASWNDWWEASGYYEASSDPSDDRPKFSICLPPPNVTGSLHLGHALTAAVQDLLIRWHRMRGYNCMWIPGTDHAGIATQTVVEKKLKKEEGRTRHDYGRQPFVEKVWEWKAEYGSTITMQLRRLGCSLDWSREVFTMDGPRAESVTEAFVRFHELGLLYRGVRLTNWCVSLKSAISDIEVEYEELTKRTRVEVPGYDRPIAFGVIWSFAYEFSDGSGEIVVATTRPETMLGDVAVAVHPADPRYAHAHGRTLRHPFVERELPIVCDAELVQMEFGTGAVKVTPAHDPNDFKCGQRHGLPMVTVFTDDGVMNDEAGPFCGSKRFEARFDVLKALKEKGLFRGEADNPMRLGLCSRTKDVIEPLLKPQWWVKCDTMAARAVSAVRTGELRLMPAFHEATWYRWLENIQDWCVSRQLWWGHRIPAWYVRTARAADGADGGGEAVGGPIVARSAAAALEHARTVRGLGPELESGALVLEQDEDVLDTWFSSGLFPFSCLGWPDGEAADMRAGWHPTTLLETGHDILFFWVARMVMCSLALTDRLPFSHVYLHAMVRDKHGQKMSKSKGNVIDPLEVINGCRLSDLAAKLDAGNLDPKEVARAKQVQTQEFPQGIPECGSDALRFGLLAYTMQGRDVNLDIGRILSYRHFSNKLWQATRFAMLNFPEGWALTPMHATLDLVSPNGPTAIVPALNDAWILDRLHRCCAAVHAHLTNYEPALAVNALHGWWYDDFCSVYLESTKPTFDEKGGADEAAKHNSRLTLYTCLHFGFRLLHPFMPFVSEELFQRVLRLGGLPHATVMTAAYPTGVASAVWRNDAVVARFETVQKVAAAIRTVRAEYLRAEHERHAPHVYVRGPAEACAVLGANDGVLRALAKSSTQPPPAEVTLLQPGQPVPQGCAMATVDSDVSVHVLLAGVIDFGAEVKRLQKKIGELSLGKEKLQKAMAAPQYAAKAPPKKKAEDASKLADFDKQLEGLQAALAQFL